MREKAADALLLLSAFVFFGGGYLLLWWVFCLVTDWGWRH